MDYNKQPVTFRKQVEKLKSRGLIFSDENKAEQVLSRISYYRLRAYTYPFQDNEDPKHPFTTTIDFDTIINLYRFDQKLRILIFDAIEKIEIALRTQIIYQLALTHGSHWHTNKSLYNDNFFINNDGNKVYFFDMHIKTLESELKRSNETFIKHYKAKYSHPTMPPAWMTLEVASMGTLSKIYKSLKPSPQKTAVAKYFGLPNVYVLENWMLSFSSTRNICAHHGRLWNRRLTANLKLPYNTKHTFYSKQEIKSLYPNKVYTILMAMNYMLKVIEPNCTFGNDIKKLMASCELDQRKVMGFTPDWDKHPFWN